MSWESFYETSHTAGVAGHPVFVVCPDLKLIAIYRVVDLDPGNQYLDP